MIIFVIVVFKLFLPSVTYYRIILMYKRVPQCRDFVGKINKWLKALGKATVLSANQYSVDADMLLVYIHILIHAAHCLKSLTGCFHIAPPILVILFLLFHASLPWRQSFLKEITCLESYFLFVGNRFEFLSYPRNVDATNNLCFGSHSSNSILIPQKILSTRNHFQYPGRKTPNN